MQKADPLLILPFDHRSSFKKLAQTQDPNTIKELKGIVFEAFLKTRDKYMKKDCFGILVDEEFGSEIIEKAKTYGIKTAIAVEKSGADAFDFEYETQFDAHIEKFKPNFVKALVRYNPQNTEINKTQLHRLKTLSEYCLEHNYKLLFELLVPANENENSEEYDTKVRPHHTMKAIEEIKEHVRVTIWKLEWFEEDIWPQILETIGKETDVIVLGRGDSQEKVEKWLTDAALFDRVIGFAVGRTVFAKPLEKYIVKTQSEEETIEEISNNFNFFVKLWKTAKGIDL